MSSLLRNIRKNLIKIIPFLFVGCFVLSSPLYATTDAEYYREVYLMRTQLREYQMDLIRVNSEIEASQNQLDKLLDLVQRLQEFTGQEWIAEVVKSLEESIRLLNERIETLQSRAEDMQDIIDEYDEKMDNLVQERCETECKPKLRKGRWLGYFSSGNSQEGIASFASCFVECVIDGGVLEYSSR